MEIIKYSAPYLETLLELEKHCFGVNATEKEEWQEILADEHTLLYLAVENGEVLAFLSIYNWGTEKNFVKITDIGTRESCRGRRIAHRLMETMMAEMKAQGMQAFAGETRVSNKAMQKVFSDFGFQVAYTMEGYYDDPTEDAYRYEIGM